MYFMNWLSNKKIYNFLISQKEQTASSDYSIKRSSMITILTGKIPTYQYTLSQNDRTF